MTAADGGLCFGPRSRPDGPGPALQSPAQLAVGRQPAVQVSVYAQDVGQGHRVGVMDFAGLDRHRNRALGAVTGSSQHVDELGEAGRIVGGIRFLATS